MASLALQFAVTGTETVQAPSCRRRIGIGGEFGIGPGLECASCIDGDGFPFAVMMTGLAGGHIEPALTGCFSYIRH